MVLLGFSEGKSPKQDNAAHNATGIITKYFVATARF